MNVLSYLLLQEHSFFKDLLLTKTDVTQTALWLERGRIISSHTARHKLHQLFIFNMTDGVSGERSDSRPLRYTATLVSEGVRE